MDKRGLDWPIIKAFYVLLIYIKHVVKFSWPSHIVKTHKQISGTIYWSMFKMDLEGIGIIRHIVLAVQCLLNKNSLECFAFVAITKQKVSATYLWPIL